MSNLLNSKVYILNSNVLPHSTSTFQSKCPVWHIFMLKVVFYTYYMLKSKEKALIEGTVKTLTLNVQNITPDPIRVQKGIHSAHYVKRI